MDLQTLFYFLGSIYFILTIAFVVFFFAVLYVIYRKAVEVEENINRRINSVGNFSKFFSFLTSKFYKKGNKILTPDRAIFELFHPVKKIPHPTLVLKKSNYFLTLE